MFSLPISKTYSPTLLDPDLPRRILPIVLELAEAPERFEKQMRRIASEAQAPVQAAAHTITTDDDSSVALPSIASLNIA